MSTKEAYRQKMEAELELAQAKLAELKAQAKVSGADVRIKYDRQIDELEQGIGTTKARLKELGEAGEDAWQQLKAGVDSAWGTVTAAVHDAAAKFKR